MIKKKIGYLGGTFDPIHFGHLNLALEALEKAHLDEIWFCPTLLSPHKEETPPIKIAHRLKMVKLATEDIPEFKVIENEAHGELPPFTYETLTNLKNDPQNQDKIFTLLLSEDLVEGLGRWHKVDRLLEEFPILIGHRIGCKSLKESDLDKNILTRIQNRKIPIRTLEISSSDLRARFKNKLYCAHLLPRKVLDYICQNELY